MPFKSEAQRKWMFAAEDRGEVPKGTAERWAKHTPNIKNLPEKVKKHEKKSSFDSEISACFVKIAKIFNSAKDKRPADAISEGAQINQARLEKMKGMDPIGYRNYTTQRSKGIIQRNLKSNKPD